MTRDQIEQALADGHLWAAMRNGRYWRLRRNGQTQLWKTRPAEFSIPVKAGLRATCRLDNTMRIATTNESDWRNANFVATSNDPNEE